MSRPSGRSEANVSRCCKAIGRRVVGSALCISNHYRLNLLLNTESDFDEYKKNYTEWTYQSLPAVTERALFPRSNLRLATRNCQLPEPVLLPDLWIR